jgi:hypothetical protein
VSTNCSERDGDGRSAWVPHQRSARYPRRSRLRTSRAAGLKRLMLLAIAACIYSGLGLWAQTSDSPADDANWSRTDTSESQSGNVNPTRTSESHTQSGNRTLDNRSIQRRGSDGNFEPYQDIEKETVRVSAATVRTTTNTYGRDTDGARTLVQVTEEERRTFPEGGSSTVRTTSNPDANGRLQVVQREIEETKKISKDVEETKTTVMLPGGNGDLAPAMKTQERRQQGANNTIESRKTTLLPDGNGNWQVGEIKRTTIRQEGKDRSIEESVSRSDLDGKLGEVSRTITREAESAPEERSKTVETYSVDVPGTTRDGSLHPVQRTTTTERTNSTGRRTTEQQVERPDPGNPDSGLRVTTVTIDTARSGSSDAHGTRTIQARDANDSLGVVSVDTTTESGGSHAVQVQIAPSEKPK